MVLLGLAVRLAWVVSQRHVVPSGDPYYYHEQANLVASGHGFINPLTYAVSKVAVPGADHPPLYVAYLALWSWFGARSVLWHLLASALAGTASVYALGRAGRLLAGRRVGAVTAFLAAVAPNLWAWDGSLAAETAAVLAVSLFALAVVTYLARPSLRQLLWVAGAAALAGLARSELILLALAVVPLVGRTSALSRRDAARWVAASALVVAVLLAPWAVYNQSRYHRPVPLSTGLGLVMASADCDDGWYGPLIGYWDFACSSAGLTAAGGDRFAAQADRGAVPVNGQQLDAPLRRVALRYVGDHLPRVPAVVGARLGRVIGLYRPIQQAQLAKTTEGQPQWLGGAVMSTWYVFAGLGIVGGLALRRAGVPLVALLWPIGVVLLSAALFYGIARFRAPADAVVVLLAGVGVDHLVRDRWERGAPADPEGLLATMARRAGAGPISR